MQCEVKGGSDLRCRHVRWSKVTIDRVRLNTFAPSVYQPIKVEITSHEEFMALLTLAGLKGNRHRTFEIFLPDGSLARK